jgi:hypothetical protein
MITFRRVRNAVKGCDMEDISKPRIRVSKPTLLAMRPCSNIAVIPMKKRGILR